MSGKFEQQHNTETTEQLSQSQQNRQELLQSITQLAEKETNPQKAETINQLAPKVIDLFEGMQPQPTHETLTKTNPKTWLTVFQSVFDTMPATKASGINKMFANPKQKGALTNFFQTIINKNVSITQKEIESEQNEETASQLTTQAEQNEEGTVEIKNKAEKLEKQRFEATKARKDNIFKNHDVECTPADKTAQLDKLGMTEEELQSKIDNSKYSKQETWMTSDDYLQFLFLQNTDNADVLADPEFSAFRTDFSRIQQAVDVYPQVDMSEPIQAQQLSNLTDQQLASHEGMGGYLWKNAAQHLDQNYYQSMSDDPSPDGLNPLPWIETTARTARQKPFAWMYVQPNPHADHEDVFG